LDCKFAFLCDYAAREGKLYALGIGWENLYAPSLPWKHPMMCFVASLRGTIAESGTKDIKLRIIDADGDDVLPVYQQQVPFDVKPPLLAGNIDIVIALGGLEFTKYGPYAFHLVVQGNEMVTLPFNVIEPPKTG
jgi:hypothetical protein